MSRWSSLNLGKLKMSSETKVCVDCGAEFVFGDKDQQFYAEMGFTPPKRCKKCRAVKKAKKEKDGRA